MQYGIMKFMALVLVICAAQPAATQAQVAVRGKTVHTMAGPAIEDGVVVMQDGKIAAVGKADLVTIPAGFRVLDAAVVTPGLIDARSTVGFSGIYNHPHDQDQLERSSPIQPELRAIDAYNPREALVEWVRSFGVTTLHTGHAPGELISGQTFIVKTAGNTVEEAMIVPVATIAATLSQQAQKREQGKSPGTRGKMMAMLRNEFLKAQEYLKKIEKAEEGKEPDRDLKLEALGQVLNGEVPLMITAHRVQDIASALRLAREFNIKIILDGGVESYLMIDEIKAAGVPVIVHPTMMRAWGEAKNMSFETAAKLKQAGVPVTIQSGYESYVPKTRVILFEAAMTASYGLAFEEALGLITIDAARILGVDQRVGSIEIGKDADLALFDGDPLEYTTHCIGTIINGEVVSEAKR
jgi:imidazolonepropionase-like amidohydrolase